MLLGVVKTSLADGELGRVVFRRRQKYRGVVFFLPSRFVTSPRSQTTRKAMERPSALCAL